MSYVHPNGTAIVTVAASSKIAVQSEGSFQVVQLVGYPNQPMTESTLTSATSGFYVSSAMSASTTIYVKAGPKGAYYEVGTDAVVKQFRGQRYQPDPTTLNATGTLTVAMILSGLVTSTTAAAVTGTLDTGAICDAGSEWAIGDSVDWSVINTGGTNAFTVAASTGHTIVGAAAVANSTSGRFRTRKTAASTFITYRL